MSIAPDLTEAVARKARGAFFTPEPIAAFLTDWAVHGNVDARVLDPTCGESVFLLSAARRLRDLGCDPSHLDEHVFGVDIHESSLDVSMRLLEDEGLDARLLASDFFDVVTPAQLGAVLPELDAVVGNPPFVRYQEHIGDVRKRSAACALAQGVRLSGLASSWAAVLVHASGFLKPEGRLAMVLPAELLTVHYAEPVRHWLRTRFASVTLVMFEQLQFHDALEKVVLVLAAGTGGCESFSLVYVDDADSLASAHVGDTLSVTPSADGKWTDLLLPLAQRRLFRQVVEEHFVALDDYGAPELGTVTGSNDFFTINETIRQDFKLRDDQLIPICPPGTKHLRGLSFTPGQWESHREADDRVWLLRPDTDDTRVGLRRYIEHGEALGINEAYKCQVRDPWWRPPTVTPPDLFFTYMSHRYPRLLANTAGVSFVNSMHGVRLRPGTTKAAKSALPLLVLNSVSMLGAELHGRSYGGGILKMEPREAAKLPVPSPEVLDRTWDAVKVEKQKLDLDLRAGRWTNVAKRVDEILLQQGMGLSGAEVADLHAAVLTLRKHRTGS